MKQKELILNPYFISGLFILLLNDFYLKQTFGNFLTGKLSDFTGLLIFPMFIAAVAPRWKKQTALITGIGFILWKLPLMTPVIDFMNQATGLEIYRVIDYTDYMALAILPLSHYLINGRRSQQMLQVLSSSQLSHLSGLSQLSHLARIKTVSQYALLGISFFAFCATSIHPRHLYEMPQGTVYIGESYTIKLPKDSVVNAIRNMGYNCDYHDKFVYHRDNRFPNDTTVQPNKRGYYQTDNIVRYWKGVNNKDTIATDTIANIKYDLEAIKPGKTKLTIINVTLPKEGNIQDWEWLRALNRQYKEWLKKNLIDEID